jgi:hypothetical protein
MVRRRVDKSGHTSFRTGKTFNVVVIGAAVHSVAARFMRAESRQNLPKCCQPGILVFQQLVASTEVAATATSERKNSANTSAELRNDKIDRRKASAKS